MKNSSITALCLAAATGLAAQIAVAQTYTASSYVQDGLVGQWDGVENVGLGLQHDPTTNYWVDLTGQSGDFALFSGVASFTDNGLKKNTAGVMATNVTATARPDVLTIEVVVSGAPASGWVNAFFITRNQTVTFANGRSNGNREYFFDYNNFGWLTLQQPAQETIAITFKSSSEAQNFRQNGALPSGSKKTNNWGAPNGSSAMHIGGRIGQTGGDYQTFGYTIHAVRLYSRALTDAEIKRNATIDQIRFFGAPAEIMPSSSKYALVATAGAGGMVAADDVNAAPNASARKEVQFSDDAYPIALRAIPLQGWKFSGWTGDFSCVTEGSASTPVIVLSSACGRVYRAAFVRDNDNPEIPYVTDGLVGRWDGIENAGEGIHNTSTNRWVDLSGQDKDFLVLSQTASFSDTGLTKTAAGVCATNLFAHSGVLTIEGAVSGVPSSGWLHAVFLTKDQTMTLRNEDGNKRQFFFDDNNLKWKMDGQPDAQTISVTYAMNGNTPQGQSFYLDGAPPQTGSVDGGNSMYWSGSAQTNTWIGGRVGFKDGGDYKTFGYTVHALRFYNRVLNAGEIAYNSAVDRLRFRGSRTEGFAYRLVSGNVQCQLRAWMDGLGGTVKLNGGAAATDCVATAWVAFGTEQNATFTATPEVGWKFMGWEGDTDAIVSGTANDLIVEVSATKGVALQAVFTQTGRYVQDGLIGFWDARENAGFGRYDANVAAWKDLTGISGDFLLNAASGVFEADSLHKVRRGRMAFNAARRTDVRTIEAVVSTNFPSGSWAMPIFVSENQHISIKDQGADKKRLFFFDYSHYGWQTDERPEQMTITLLSESETSAVKVYVNAAEPTGSATSNWWGDSGGMMAIGARESRTGGDATATGYRVHAIRFYNRQLTEAEIERNARRDAIRYFGEAEAPYVITIR